jgi:hypothetical protein
VVCQGARKDGWGEGLDTAKAVDCPRPHPPLSLVGIPVLGDLATWEGPSNPGVVVGTPLPWGERALSRGRGKAKIGRASRQTGSTGWLSNQRVGATPGGRVHARTKSSQVGRVSFSSLSRLSSLGRGDSRGTGDQSPLARGRELNVALRASSRGLTCLGSTRLAKGWGDLQACGAGERF